MENINSGVGQGMTRAKQSPATLARIEWVIMMNDRYLDCLDRNDIDGLVALALEYDIKGMRRTARAIMLDVATRKAKHDG